MPSKKSNRLIAFLRTIRNRYVLTGIGFLVWMTFFDKNDFITTFSYKRKLDQLKEQQSYYEKEISTNKA
ncbi:MAG: septum formation initiator family protein, partial [Flavobacteriales bacterium]